MLNKRGVALSFPWENASPFQNPKWNLSLSETALQVREDLTRCGKKKQYVNQRFAGCPEQQRGGKLTVNLP